MANTVDSMQEAFAPLRTSRFAMFTSFKRNGQGVGTPIAITIINGKIYFITWSTAWKVKRIANNPRVTLATCTQRGKVTGPSVEGIARKLEGTEEEQAYKALGFNFFRWLFTQIYKLRYHAPTVLIEVTPGQDQSA